jgi:hypothetical protein
VYSPLKGDGAAPSLFNTTQAINDALAQVEGDLSIAALAAWIRTTLQPYDFVALQLRAAPDGQDDQIDRGTRLN